MEGYDRLKKLYLEGQCKDKALIKIVKYLMMKSGMDAVYANESKNLENMMKYINMKAKEQAVNNMAVIEDNVVYNWASKYFTEPDSVLGLQENKTIQNKGSKVVNKDIKEDKNQLRLEI